MCGACDRPENAHSILKSNASKIIGIDEVVHDMPPGLVDSTDSTHLQGQRVTLNDAVRELAVARSRTEHF